jgi:glycogen debranching enzyme
VLVRAETDLAWLSERCGVETEAAARAARVRTGLEEHLWDEELGRYLYYDAHARSSVSHDLVGCYLPLFCGVREDRAARLVAGLEARYLGVPWPIPSTAPSDPAFEAKRYWRGPTWVNVSWMLKDALGPSLVERTLALVREHGIWEYYHPYEGRGLGGERFTWTAALALDLLEG